MTPCWDAELLAPPEPGVAAWFGPTTGQLPPVQSVHTHQHWAGVLGELTDYPGDARALIWLRRRDAKGRESVGNLMWAIKEADGVKLIAPLAGSGEPMITSDPFELKVFRVK